MMRITNAICLFLIVALVVGCGLPKEMDRDSNIKNTIELLSKKTQCDDAYTRIINIGFPVIPYLIENSSNTTVFEGSKIYNPASSLLVGKPAVGLVSLYLIDCIVMDKETPYLAPLLVTNESSQKDRGEGAPVNCHQDIVQAAKHYVKWWNRVKDIDSTQVPKVSPLVGTEFRWWGM